MSNTSYGSANTNACGDPVNPARRIQEKTDTRPSGEIRVQMNMQQDCIGELETIVEHLEADLSAVVGPAQPRPANAEVRTPPPSLSALGNTLLDNNGRLRALAFRLRDLKDRCQL